MEKEKIIRLPEWLKPKIRGLGRLHEMKKRLRGYGLHTVCESAKCPNIAECFSRPTATVMIMGNQCTRACTFCAVSKASVEALDPDEPDRLARMARELGLKHLVITSVTRDDLPDGGARHFLNCIEAVKIQSPSMAIEILTPDFKGDESCLALLAASPIDVFNHNVETVPRLYESVRPQADFKRSCKVLKYMSENGEAKVVKSGFMVGLGETETEITQLQKALFDNGVQALTIGQYMRPSLKNHPVVRYVAPKEFEGYRQAALKIGFKFVASAPLVRSSYMADELIR
jgi:lipoyl synthase